MRELLQHPQQRRFLVQQARKTAEHHSWSRETRKLEDHYRAAIVLARSSGPLGRMRRIIRG